LQADVDDETGEQQESPLGILTSHSDPPHPSVSQMLARSSIYNRHGDGWLIIQLTKNNRINYGF